MLAFKLEEKNLIASGDLNNSSIHSVHEPSIQLYNLQLSKCKFEYYYDIESFWTKHKINKNITNSNTNTNKESNQIPFNAENNKSKTLDLIQEFSFFLRLEIGNDTKCNFDITQVNININNYLTNKLSGLSEVFKLDTKADIFESKFKTKNEITKNSTKMGKVEFIAGDGIVKKFYCVLAGGFIYLFEKTVNEFADVTIPLKHLEFERIVDIEAKKFGLKIRIGGVKASTKKQDDAMLFEYYFGFDNVNTLDSWVTAINERKSLMNSFSEN